MGLTMALEPKEVSVRGEFEPRLLLRGDINHNYLIANQILSIEKIMANPENSPMMIQEAIMGLIHLIPTQWKDDEFRKHLGAAIGYLNRNVRPSFCGLRASDEVCQKMGVPSTVRELSINYYLALQACLDLLQRRGKLSKKILTEKMTGKKHGALGEPEDVSETDFSQL